MLRIIRLLAEDSLNVFIEPHARQQMKRRKITRTQVIACLQHGVCLKTLTKTSGEIGNAPYNITMQVTW